MNGTPGTGAYVEGSGPNQQNLYGASATLSATTGITVSESTIGSSSAMAIMDPFSVVNFIIKT
jgi:hypothetical protein